MRSFSSSLRLFLQRGVDLELMTRVTWVSSSRLLRPNIASMISIKQHERIVMMYHGNVRPIRSTLSCLFEKKICALKAKRIRQPTIQHILRAVKTIWRHLRMRRIFSWWRRFFKRKQSGMKIITIIRKEKNWRASSRPTTICMWRNTPPLREVGEGSSPLVGILWKGGLLIGTNTGSWFVVDFIISKHSACELLLKVGKMKNIS